MRKIHRKEQKPQYIWFGFLFPNKSQLQYAQIFFAIKGVCVWNVTLGIRKRISLKSVYISNEQLSQLKNPFCNKKKKKKKKRKNREKQKKLQYNKRNETKADH